MKARTSYLVQFFRYSLLVFLVAVYQYGIFASTYVTNRSTFTSTDSITPNSNLKFLDGMNLGADVEKLSEAQGYLDNAIEYGQIMSKIASGNWISLPMKSTVKVGNITTSLVVGKITLQQNYTEIDVYMSIELPSGKRLMFGAPSLKLNSAGGLNGEIKLALLADYVIDLGANKSVLIVKRAINGKYGGTYVSIDCDGFKSLSLDAEVVFSRDVVVPTDNGGNQLPNQYVRGHFHAIVSDWNDILAEISLPNFAMPDYTDIAFSLNNAVIDLSDLKNSPSVKFPNGYDGETDVLWRGVYIQSLRAILPPQMKKRGQSERLQASVNHLIIDNTGVSGSFGAGNVLALNEGIMNKWAYSLDTLNAEILQNQIVGFGFGGLIRPPVLDDREQGGILYSAFFKANHEFTLTASIPKAVKFRFLQAAKVSIDRSSTIELSVRQDDFYPSAILNGSMEINASLSGEQNEYDSSNSRGIKLAKIDFQRMVLNPEPEYLKIGTLSLTTGKLANFPIQIHKIEFLSAGTQSALHADLSLNLMEEAAGAFNLRTAFHINTSMQNDEVQQWKFKNIQLDAILLNMDIGPIKLNGALNIFDNDPEYATGFCGTIDATFKISDSKTINAQAAVIFGRTTDFRYWYADALVTGFKLPIAPSVDITGFGGGAYRKMKMVAMNTSGGINCVSTSNLKYVPDAGQGLGIKASVFLASSTKSLFTADATFELNFNATGGIGHAGFLGNGQFMVNKSFDIPVVNSLNNRLSKMCKVTPEALKAEDKKTATESKDAVAFQLLIDLDFNQDIYQGAFSLFVNIANGKLKGNSTPPSALAGVVDIYFSKNRWHIYLGNYASRLALLTELAKLKVSASAYFMTGNDLTAPPGIDPKIAKELKISIDQVSKDRSNYNNDLNTGSGFALGANLNISYDNNGNKLKIRINAGAGFEFYCFNLGFDRSCPNGYGPPIGSNGWRAGGSIYLYANVFVKYWGISAEPGLALLINGQIPNPNYFEAYLRVLFVKLNFNIGESCPLQ